MAQTSPASSNRNYSARWLTVALLAVIAACLLVELGFSTGAAKAQDTRPQIILDYPSQVPPAAAQAGVIQAVPAQITGDSYGLYLVDAEKGTICLYQYVSGSRTAAGKLRLLAARNISFDVRLDELNTEPPPREIKAIVDQYRRLNEGEPAQPQPPKE